MVWKQSQAYSHSVCFIFLGLCIEWYLILSIQYCCMLAAQLLYLLFCHNCHCLLGNVRDNKILSQLPVKSLLFILYLIQWNICFSHIMCLSFSAFIYCRPTRLPLSSIIICTREVVIWWSYDTMCKRAVHLRPLTKFGFAFKVSYADTVFVDSRQHCSMKVLLIVVTNDCPTSAPEVVFFC